VSLKGECLCGAVKYTYDGELGDVLNCHCSECRKWHGSAFRTRAAILKKDFRWLQGEDNVSHYDGLSNTIKTFCKTCGSNLISYYKHDTEMLGLPLGAVEGLKDRKPQYHIFTNSKASWYDIDDDLPQYPELPGDAHSIHKIKE